MADFTGITVTRTKEDDKQTLGTGTVVVAGRPVYAFKTLELPWLGNERNVSRIKPGVYKITKEIHARFNKALRLHEVPGRSGVLVHRGNYRYDIRGCILPGVGFADLDKDGHLDVTSSVSAMTKIYELLPDDVPLQIRIIDP